MSYSSNDHIHPKINKFIIKKEVKAEIVEEGAEDQDRHHNIILIIEIILNRKIKHVCISVIYHLKLLIRT